MVSTTSSIPVGRHRDPSPAAALLLTIGGSILVVGICVLALACVAVAAVAVFGSGILEAL